MKFRKKPVVIEAEQFTDDNYENLKIFLFNHTGEHLDLVVEESPTEIKIETLEGMMTADKGDWIIRGVHGEFYPVKPDVFEKTYELVEDEGGLNNE